MAMARVDDLNGSTENVKPEVFGYGGQVYSIDLDAKNRTELQDALKKYIAAARPIGTLPPADEVVDLAPQVQATNGQVAEPSFSKTPPPRRTAGKKAAVAAKKTTAPRKRAVKTRDVAHVRSWAAQKGFSLPQTGRIPNEVLDQYDKAHAGV